MAGVLNFSDYLGGPDNLQLLQTFPATQKVFTYDFGTSVSSYAFALDYQVIVVDPLSFDRNTGEPNFAASEVIGTFPKVDLHGGGTNWGSGSGTQGTSLAAAGASFAPAWATTDSANAWVTGQAIAGTYVRTNGSSANKVDVLFPAYMYKGSILPDARSKVPIVVASFSWANASGNTAAVESHRFAFLQAWEPDATAGDPTTSTNYIAITA